MKYFSLKVICEDHDAIKQGQAYVVGKIMLCDVQKQWRRMLMHCLLACIQSGPHKVKCAALVLMRSHNFKHAYWTRHSLALAVVWIHRAIFRLYCFAKSCYLHVTVWFTAGLEPHSALPTALPMMFNRFCRALPSALRDIKVLATSAVSLFLMSLSRKLHVAERQP